VNVATYCAIKNSSICDVPLTQCTQFGAIHALLNQTVFVGKQQRYFRSFKKACCILEVRNNEFLMTCTFYPF
jgi:hypothetical protein